MTAYGRTKLLDDLRKIQAKGGRPLYVDTDAVLFSLEPNMLGQVEDALGIDDVVYGAYKAEEKTPIISYSAISAKNYSYRCETSGKEVTK